MKNKPIDLNNHLFAAIERLNDESISGDQLKEEVERGRTIAGLAKQVIDQQKNILLAERLRTDRDGDFQGSCRVNLSRYC